MAELLRLTDDFSPLRSLFPAFTARQTDEAVFVRAEIPGFSRDDVTLTIEGDRLTITGELPAPEEGAAQPAGVTRKFERVLTLPYRVDAEAADAKVEHGILELRLPRVAGELPQRIAIKTS
jgi:HSP20 family protein